MRLRTVCLIIAIFFIAQQSPAPIVFPYPGLSGIVKKADVIVVGRIEGIPERYFSGGDFTVRVVKTIKGETKENTTHKMFLRHLPLSDANHFPKPDGNRPDFLALGSTYILVLRYYPDVRDQAPHRSLNMPGAVWEISPHVNLHDLKVESPQKAIVALLKQTADIHTRQAERIQKMLKIIDKEETFEQKAGEATSDSAPSAKSEASQP